MLFEVATGALGLGFRVYTEKPGYVQFFSNATSLNPKPQTLEQFGAFDTAELSRKACKASEFRCMTLQDDR